MVRRICGSASARATNAFTSVFGLPIPTGRPSTTSLPTRPRVASTHCSGPQRTGAGEELMPTGATSAASLLQQQREAHLDFVTDGLDVLPFSLADAEIEPLEVRVALEPRAARLLLEREL